MLGFNIATILALEFTIFGYFITAFWLVTGSMCGFIFNHLYQLNRRETKYLRWKFIVNTFIRNAIFYEHNISPADQLKNPRAHSSDLIPTPKRLQNLLSDTHFCKLMTDELLSAMQNMSGTAASNIKKIFYQLKLDSRTSRMLENYHWHIQAAGIQQVGIMGMEEFKGNIANFINHERKLLRVEAHNTMLKLLGFNGLKFLDDATYPISEWQQIKILEELSQFPPENFKGIEKWLKSKNDNVVILALKLTKLYFRFELYEDVKACLTHANSDVRRQAILACADLQTIDTATQLMLRFHSEDEKNQLQIIKSLAQIGGEEEIPFLESLLFSENKKVVIAAGYSLAALGEMGMSALETHTKAQEYPLDRIVTQLKSEAE